VIREVYGNPEKSDFDNISSMCWFFTPKQSVLWKLLVDRGIIAKNRTPANLFGQAITKSGQGRTPDHLS